MRGIRVVTLMAAVLLGLSGAASAGTAAGPSTTVGPYVLPVAQGVDITSLWTVADLPAGDGFGMVGIPDGLGGFRQGANLVLLMNHELPATEGIVRRHGQQGAFVSRLVLDPKTLEVKEGADLINPGVVYWDYATGAYSPTPSSGQLAAFGRFCSGTLAPAGRFFNPDSGRGYRGGVYFANEETGTEGRVFGVTMNGDARQLPRLGLLSWENTVPAANHSDTTLVIGMDDNSSQGYNSIFIGRKQRSGSPLDKAGLTNGGRYGLKVPGATTDADFRANYGKNQPAGFTLESINWNQTGAQQAAEAAAKQTLRLARPEDGHWDPNHPNDFYFVTTIGSPEAGSSPPRNGGGLWRLRFTDIEDPMAGGTLTLLLDGTEAPYLNMPDNLTIDRAGNLLLQEDPGNNDHLSRIVAYDLDTGDLGVVARFDQDLFGPGAGADPARLTVDEESSGIIDAAGLLGEGWFLFDAQVHTTKGLPPGTGPGTVQELVERGQLLAMHVTDWEAVYHPAAG